jgi:hypothetical protein
MEKQFLKLYSAVTSAATTLWLETSIVSSTNEQQNQ